MEKVTLQYRPISFLSWSKPFNVEHPSKWDELTAKQLIAVACLFHGTINEHRLIQIMLNIPKRVIKQLDEYQVFKLIELMEFLKDKRPPYQEFILKELKVGRLKLIAPNKQLKGVTFGEFIFADTYYMNYALSSEEKDLNKFIACFYRNAVKGAKVPFKENELEHKASLISKLPLHEREAVAMNYGMIREWLERSYIYVFPKVEEESKKARAKKKSAKGNWVEVFDNLVGDDIVNEQRYAELPASTVLRKMNKAIKENLKNKRHGR